MKYVQLIYVQRKTWRLSNVRDRRLQLNTQRCWIWSQSAINSDRQGLGSQRLIWKWFNLMNNITYSTSSVVYGVSERSLLLKLSFILIKLWICKWIWHRLLSSLYKQEKWKYNSLIYDKDIIAHLFNTRDDLQILNEQLTKEIMNFLCDCCFRFIHRGRDSLPTTTTASVSSQNRSTPLNIRPHISVLKGL